jgi:hypothetical protein
MKNAKRAVEKKSATKAMKLSDRDLAEISAGYGSQTAGGGNTSIWGKIKSLWFGVDASFYA